jgi:hypothetical protein
MSYGVEKKILKTECAECDVDLKFDSNPSSDLLKFHPGLLDKLIMEQPKIVNIQQTENLAEALPKSTINNQDQIKLFLDQSIEQIRSKSTLFEDKFFIRHISSIVNTENSQLFTSLKYRLMQDAGNNLETKCELLLKLFIID